MTLNQEIVQYIEESNKCMNKQASVIKSLANHTKMLDKRHTEDNFLIKLSNVIKTNNCEISNIAQAIDKRDLSLIKEAQETKSWGTRIRDEQGNASSAEEVLYKRFGH